MRGEYSILFLIYSSSRELPPRARRILEQALANIDLHGTTSACAENTGERSVFRCRRRNYLRVRGEYFPGARNHSSCWELPPRARRIPPPAPNGSPRRGTTSACAENTPHHLRMIGGMWNYLRVRGEYIRLKIKAQPRAELPPRARRIPQRFIFPAFPQGTTSACAENTAKKIILDR